MTGLSKMLTKERLMRNDPLSRSEILKQTTKVMSIEQLYQELISNDEDNNPLSRSTVLKTNTGGSKRKQRQLKHDHEVMRMKKKSKIKRKSEDCAQPIGNFKFSEGDGEEKKCHYETFKFHGKNYRLEDSVTLIPEEVNQEPYVAIIKDIFVQGKEEHVKLEVQWFYRLEDVDKRHVRNWESKDSSDLFYSFHRDEVFAESVKSGCLVYFLTKNQQIPDCREQADFIVQNIYDTIKKKLRNFDDEDFNEMQKLEVDLLVAKTISQFGYLHDIEKEQKSSKFVTHKQNVLKRYIINVDATNSKTSIVVNPLAYRSILEKFDMSTGDSNRDKGLEELLKAVKHKCRVTKKQKAGDYDFFWPSDVVPTVLALEKVLYESSEKDIPEYNTKLEVLVDKLKISRLLAERLLKGELKPKKIITMTDYELMNGHTFNEITADIGEDFPSSKDA